MCARIEEPTSPWKSPALISEIISNLQHMFPAGPFVHACCSHQKKDLPSWPHDHPTVMQQTRSRTVWCMSRLTMRETWETFKKHNITETFRQTHCFVLPICFLNLLTADSVDVRQHRSLAALLARPCCLHPLKALLRTVRLQMFQMVLSAWHRRHWTGSCLVMCRFTVFHQLNTC